MHGALGLAGGAGGVEQLDDGVGVRPAAGEFGIGVELVFPAGFEQHAVEAVRPVVADRQHALQMRQLAAQAGQHGRVVEAAEAVRHHQQLGLRELQHERQLALAKNRHQRIADRADAQARQVQRHELPPVGQLEGHHVTRLDAQAKQAERHAVGAVLQLQVRQARGKAGDAVVVDHGQAVRVAVRDLVEHVGQQAIAPQAGVGHGGDAGG
ncbi:MAG: hypothetical protein OZX49_01914 [Immundisolibacter sp.]|nr:hypothetical protein [Immundisolibacter sp.]